MTADPNVSLPWQTPVGVDDLEPSVYRVLDDGTLDTDTWRKTIVAPPNGEAVFYVRLGPGASSPRHWHPSDTVYIVRRGELSVIPGEGTYRGRGAFGARRHRLRARDGRPRRRRVLVRRRWSVRHHRPRRHATTGTSGRRVLSRVAAPRSMPARPVRHIDDDERLRRLARRHALIPHITKRRTLRGHTGHDGAPRNGGRVGVPVGAGPRPAHRHRRHQPAALYDDRTIVKQLAMRRTLFVFPRELLPAAWGSTSARVADADGDASRPR